jgi:hypothetical protein
VDDSLRSTSGDPKPKGLTANPAARFILRARGACIACAACIFAAATMVVSLPERARADLFRDATDRAGVEFRRPPSAAGTAIRLPPAPAIFGEGEPAVGGERKVAVYRTDTPQNFEISLRLNPASDAAEDGIALRLLSPRDYYVVRIDGRGERVAFLRVSEGRAHEIASAERRVVANAWHSLRVQAEDDRFTVTLDGEWLFTAYDAGLCTAGHLAVWTGAGNPVRFEAIAVSPLTPE